MSENISMDNAREILMNRLRYMGLSDKDFVSLHLQKMSDSKVSRTFYKGQVHTFSKDLNKEPGYVISNFLTRFKLEVKFFIESPEGIKRDSMREGQFALSFT